MQIINQIKNRTQKFVEDNATTILTAVGAVGVVGTGVLAWRGGYKYYDVYRDAIDEHNAVLNMEDEADRAKYMTVDTVPVLMQAKLIAPYLAPPVITGGLAVASIVMSHRMNAQKAAALAAAYGLSQKQLEEYKDKVTEKLGLKKEQTIQDELAQDRVDKAPESSQIIIMDGEVLCFDQPSGRYFKSTMEKINSAVNCTNEEIIHHELASASFFYEELGLPPTTWSDQVGWNRERLVELAITTVKSPDNQPALAIDFKALPKLDYVPRHY